MEDEKHCKIQRILKLTLEFICLLTGEECILVRKSSRTNGKPNHSKSRSMEPSSSTPTLNSNEEILQLIKKITELLTEKVPIRCQDVTVCFSTEEWEYFEGHKDLYKGTMRENRPPLTSPDGSSKSNLPERCPRPLDSQDSTEEHHNIPQVHSLSSRNSTQEHHEIPHAHPLYSQHCTQEHHEIPQAHPVYSQDSTPKDHFISQVQKQINGTLTEKTKGSDDTERTHEAPVMELPERSENSKAEVSNGSITSNQTEAKSAMENSPKRSGEDTIPAALSDTNNVSNSKTKSEDKNSSDVAGQSSITLRQTEPEAVAWNLTKEVAISLKQTEDTTINSNHSEAVDNTSRPFRDDTLPPVLQIRNPNAVVCQTTVSSKQAEADSIILHLTEEATISSKQTEPDAIAKSLTKEATTINSNLPETADNPPRALRDDTLHHLLEIENPNAMVCQNTINSNQATIDSITLHFTEEATVSSKQTESNTINVKPTEADSAVDILPTAFRDHTLPPLIIIRNPKTRFCQTTIASNQTEAGAITLHLTEETTLSSKQIEANAINSNPSEAEVDNPPKALRVVTLPPALQIRNTNILVCKATIISNEKEADSSVVIPTEATLVPPLQDTNNVFNCEAMKKTTMENSTAITSNETEANSAVHTPTITCRDGTLPAPLKDRNVITHLEAMKNKRIRNSKSMFGHSATAFKQTDLDLDNPTKVFGEDTHPAPLRDTNNIFSSDKTQQITVNSSRNMVDHRATKENQTEGGSAVVNLATTRNYTLHGLLKGTKNVSNFEATKNTNIKHSEAVTSHNTVTSTNIEVASALKMPTASSTDDTPPSPILDMNNPSNSERREERKNQNASGVLDHSSITTNQSIASSALSNPTKTEDLLPAPLKDTNNLSSSEATKKMAGQSAITLNQTTANSAVATPKRALRGDTLLAPFRKTHNIFKSLKTLRITITNQTDAVDNPILPSPWDGNNISNFEAMKNKQIKDSMVVVGHGTTISANMKVMSVLNHSSSASKDDPPNVPSKDTNNVSDCETREERTIQKSNGVAGHSHIHTNQSKANSALNDSTPVWRDDMPLVLLKDTNDKATTKINTPTAVGHSIILSRQTVTLNNPTRASKIDTLPVPIKDTNNTVSSEKMEYQNPTNSKSVAGHSVTAPNQTKSDSAVDKPTTCGEDSHVTSLKDISISEETKKNELKNSRSVIVYSAVPSNRTEADSAVENSLEACKDNTLPAPLKDTNNMANYEETKNNNNSMSVIVYSTITSNPTKVDSALNKPAATSTDNTQVASLNDADNVSNPAMTNGERHRKLLVDRRIASIQTEIESVVVRPTKAICTSTPHTSFKDPNNVPNYSKTKMRNMQNTDDVVGYNPITTNQTEANSASNDPTTTCMDGIFLVPLEGTNIISNCEAAIKIKQSTAVTGSSTIKANQTKPDVALNNPTNDNSYNLEAIKNKNLKNLSLVASSAVTSNQAKDDVALDNLTVCQEDSHTALLKDTKQISNDEETKKNKKESSKSAIVYNTATSNQTEMDTALNKPATNFRDNKPSPPLNDINNVSNFDMKKGEKIKNSMLAIGCGSMIFNQPEVDTAVNKLTGAYRDTTLPASVKDTDNTSSSKTTKKRKIKNSKSVGGHRPTTSNQSKRSSSVDSLTCREDSHIAPLRDTKCISNSEETKKYTMRNSRSVVIYSDQTETDSALNKPAAACIDHTPSPTKNETSNVSKSVKTKGGKRRGSTSAVGCDTITPIQTEVENIQTEVDNTPPSSLKEPNNVSQASKKRQMKISKSTVDHSTTTSNQIKGGSAIENSTDCSEDSHIVPLKDINNISNSEETKKNQINSGSVADHETMMSNQTEEDFSLNYSTKTHSLPPPLEEANNVSNSDGTNRENIINPAAAVGNSTITSSMAETNSPIEEPVGVCSGNVPTAILNGTNNILNTEATENAEATDEYITLYLVEVSPFLDDPSIDHNNETQAPIVSSLDDPSRDCNDKVSAIPETVIDNNHFKSNDPEILKKNKREKKHKCCECGKLFLFNAHLVVHLRSHTGERPFSCPECGKGFVSKPRLASHQRFHYNEKPYSCTECEKSFYNKSHLQLHLKFHRNERPYSCPECRKTFIHKSNCLKHQEIHMGVKPHLCSYCGRRFRQSSHLRSHLKQHTEDLRFSCIKCRKKFQTEGALFSHYKFHRITPLSCPECSKHFINRVSFERHQRLHTGHKLLSCSECGRCFINKTHLSIHLRIHSGEKPFACTICERRFTDKSAYNRHNKTHTATTPEEHPETAKGSDKQRSFPTQAGPDIATKQFFCPQCKKCFKTEENLTKHQQSHSKEDVFPCSDCGQHFATEALLVAHICHLGKNNFSCSKCDTGFKTQPELEKHQRNHPEEKFVCEDCNRCFTNKMLLAIHKLKHLGTKLFSCEKCKKGFKTQMELDAHEENHLELNQDSQVGEKEIPSSNGDKGFKTPQELETSHQKNHLEKELFSCSECGQCFDSEALLAAHEKHHHGKNSFLCTKCNIDFATQLELETHENNHPENKFLCNDCNSHFTSKSLLTKHQKMHLGKLFSCEKCNKGFRTQRQLEAHEKNHPKLHQKPHPTKKQLSSDKGIKTQQELEEQQQSHVQRKPFRCGTCGHRFTNQTRLEAHQKKHIEKQFLCLICKKSFKTQPELKTHQKNDCDKKPFLCGDCGRRFASETLLAAHQERHVSKKRYMCLECGYGFNEKSNFEKHCRIHTGERPYSCSECGKTFAVKSNMIRHCQIHTGERPYNCLECGKSFRNKSYFIIHQKIHTGVQEYSCSQCSKTFRDKSNYQRHRKSHIVGKQFPCTECGKSFRSPTQLTIHARTHSRQTFECAFCGKNFKNNWCLNKHTKIHTRKK